MVNLKHERCMRKCVLKWSEISQVPTQECRAESPNLDNVGIGYIVDGSAIQYTVDLCLKQSCSELQ